MPSQIDLINFAKAVTQLFCLSCFAFKSLLFLLLFDLKLCFPLSEAAGSLRLQQALSPVHLSNLRALGLEFEVADLHLLLTLILVDHVKVSLRLVQVALVVLDEVRSKRAL